MKISLPLAAFLGYIARAHETAEYDDIPFYEDYYCNGEQQEFTDLVPRDSYSYQPDEPEEPEEENDDEYSYLSVYDSLRRSLKLVRGYYTKTTSYYTKTTTTKTYYKPPVTKKVYTPPKYVKVKKPKTYSYT